MVKRCKWIQKVLKERPKFRYFFPVACLDTEHHFQLPTLTALILSLHLHLIQHSFNGQATGDMESQLKGKSQLSSACSTDEPFCVGQALHQSELAFPSGACTVP